jgi:hypothetical protein
MEAFTNSIFQLSPLTTSTNPLQLQLIHTKSNFGQRSEDLRFEIHFEGDRVLFTKSKAPSKDEKEMQLIHEGMVEMMNEGIEIIAKNITRHLKGVLGRDKLLALLDKGTGNYWDKKPRLGRGGGKLYEPRELPWNPDYIYNQETRKVQEDDLDPPPDYMDG